MKVDYWSSTKKIQLKKNSIENSAEKNLKENWKINELWNFSIKQRNKWKSLKFKELCFPDTHSDRFPTNRTQNLQHYLFYPFLSCFFCIKFPFEKLYCLCYLFESVSELESLQNLLFKFTVWITANGTLKPPKNITLLNTNHGFRVTHIPPNFIP